MMKRILTAILIISILATGFSFNAFAASDLSKFDGLFKEVEKKLLAGKRVEGKVMTGIKSGGDPVYTVYPKITDAMIKPLIADYIQKLKNSILELGELSQADTNKVIDIFKNSDYRATYSWKENKVTMLIYPEPSLDPIKEAKQIAAVQTAAEAFFKNSASKPSAWARPAVQQAIELGLVPENIQSNYQQPITNEEFACLFVNTIFTWNKNASNIYSEEYLYSREEFLSHVKAIDYNFKDVDNPEVKIAYLMGLVDGISDTVFAPDKVVTRQEAAVMLVNYFQEVLYIDNNYSSQNVTDLGKAAAWAKDSLVLSFYNGIMAGTTNRAEVSCDSSAADTMDPLGYYTREQAIADANHIYQKYITKGLQPCLRGTISFDPSIEYEVSKNSVTALSINERYFRRENGIIAKNVLTYAPFKALSPINRAEQVEAMTLGRYSMVITLWSRMGIGDIAGWTGHGYTLFSGLPFVNDKKLVDALYSGDNHLIDLGWTTVEINGNGFIYKYKLKNNGFHTDDYYEGTKCTPALYKLIW